MKGIGINNMHLKCYNYTNENLDNFVFFEVNNETDDIDNLDITKLKRFQNPLLHWDDELVILPSINILIVGRNIIEQLTTEFNILLCYPQERRESQPLKSITHLLLNLGIDADVNRVNVFFVSNDLSRDHYIPEVITNINFYYITSKFEGLYDNIKISNQKIKFNHILFDSSVIKFIKGVNIVRESWRLLEKGGSVHIPELIKNKAFFGEVEQARGKKQGNVQAIEDLGKDKGIVLHPDHYPYNQHNPVHPTWYYILKKYNRNIFNVEKMKKTVREYLILLDLYYRRIPRPYNLVIHKPEIYNGGEKGVAFKMPYVSQINYVEVINIILDTYGMSENKEEIKGAYYDTYPLYHPPWPSDDDKKVKESYYIKAIKN